MSPLDPKNSKDPGVSEWRSLGDLEDSPELLEFLENEFPDSGEQLADPLSRRRFMQLMGASLAFAGVAGAGCKRWEKEEIVPLSRRPEGFVPGKAVRYSSAMELGGAALGVLVTAYDGRPIKIEGNPDHPFTGGASTTFAQASILELYDPDRSKSVYRQQDGQALAGSWDEFASFARQHFGAMANGGAGFRVLAESSSSPTLRRLRQQLERALPQARWYEYEPLSRDNEALGTRLAMGQALRPMLSLDRAARVLLLDADLLVDHPAALRYARDFAQARRPESGQLNRVYAVESAFSSTGAAADHRLPLRAELILPFLMALDAALGGGTAPQSSFLQEPKIAGFLEALAEDLAEHRGRAVLAAGPRQPPEVHALVAKINADLGAVDQTVRYVPVVDPDRAHHHEQLRNLVTEMNAGQVQTLLVLGGNPVYNAPGDVDFAGALAKVGASIHLSAYHDETSAACSWHLPRAHYLEAWGDARTWDGTLTMVQPVIEPMWGGRSAIEVLSMVLGEPDKDGHRLVRDTFRLFGGDDAGWRRALHYGFVANTAFPAVRTPRATAPAPQLSQAQLGGSRAANGQLEVVFTASPHSYDGRFANNGWLQETPDFITKLTWDNAALISPRTAEELGVRNRELIEIEVGGRTLEVPVWTQPGQAPSSIGLALGHGRTRAGHVGGLVSSKVKPTGFDTYRLLGAGALVASGATVRATGKDYLLASTQDHWAIEKRGRAEVTKRAEDFVRTYSLTKYQEAGFDVNEGAHHPPLQSLWKEFEYNGYKWGMATDLTNCIGCNACMVACQAENNVPVVGKDQVARSREMHWIRIDRYFTGDKEDPQVSHQPMTCQHCEMAACEQVCPVGATLHTSEGLNDMIYNRCVGTRYCLNNCPYRVRRFNFFDWHKDLKEARNKVRQLVFNPEVTVRDRGVMEKCTFCVQRIEGAKITAKNEKRLVRDGEIQTACQQACPTGAITFGDLNNPKAEVTALHDPEKTPRAYQMLADLHPKTRNLFLAKVRNPNPRLA